MSYVASISEKIGQITATSNLEAKPHLRRNNRIKSIHSSLKIEANSLTVGQVRDFINGKVVLGKQKEIQKVKNAYTAYDSHGGTERCKSRTEQGHRRKACHPEDVPGNLIWKI